MEKERPETYQTPPGWAVHICQAIHGVKALREAIFRSGFLSRSFPQRKMWEYGQNFAISSA
jgi:hypothetical protein